MGGETVRLADLTDGTDITYGVVQPGELDADGVLFVRGGDVKAGQIALRDLRTIAASVASTYRRTQLRGGELLVSLVGNPGESAVVPTELAGANIARQVALVRLDPKKANARYVDYYLRSPKGKSELHYKSLGSVQTVINLRDLRELPIPRLDIGAQGCIAEVLGALDDKIELNQRISETLGATARALFKSWFVDFDPVHAKTEGRQTGLLDAASALFPDHFNDNGVPGGWRVSTIGGLFEVVSGSTPSTAETSFWNGHHAWATPKDLSSLSSPVLLQTDRRLSDVGLARVSSGLLPSGSLLLSSRAPIGYMAFATEPVAINQGFAGVLRRDVSTAYAWLWFDANMDLVRGNAGGSTFPEISKSILRTLPMLEPSAPVIGLFNSMVEPIVGCLVSLARQSRNLASLRDTLLPKLISGELRIRDAERTVAAA